jgi:hypothetical protein
MLTKAQWKQIETMLSSFTEIEVIKIGRSLA